MALWALIFGLTSLVSSPAPSYRGKTLSLWIVPFCHQTTNGLDAPAGPEHFEQLQPVRRAIAQFGTNALPFLIASLNQRESALHRTVRQLADKQRLVTFRLADPRVRQVRAIQRLGTFGPAASNAVPALLPLLEDRNPMTRQATVRSLGEIRCQSELVVPALTNLLSDPDLGTQMEAISALQAFGYDATFQPRQPGRLGAPSASPFSRRTHLF